MRSRALAFFLVVVMAWMGFSAQTEAASATSEGLSAHVLATQTGDAPAHLPGKASGALDDHHLDELPLQLLADLVGLLRPPGVAGAQGLTLRHVAPLAQAGPTPHLAGLRRPPIARA